jgi:hypothetical protein
MTEEENAFTHHCGSFGSRFWPLCHGLKHRLAREFNRDEADQHAFNRERGALPRALPSPLVLASSVLAQLLVMCST